MRGAREDLIEAKYEICCADIETPADMFHVKGRRFAGKMQAAPKKKKLPFSAGWLSYVPGNLRKKWQNN